MRTLNTKAENSRKFSRFSLPGFRSGSLIKKIIACIYYCFVFVNVVVNGFKTALQMDFQGGTDIFLFALFLLCAVGAFLAPVIIVGFSDYYDLHGIKLVLAVVSAMCVFMTCAMFVSSFFSDSLKGINTELEQSVSESAGSEKKDETSPELENALIEENIEKTKEESADSSASSSAE